MIFIDTNIYLRFYDSNAKEYKKLLDSLIEVKEHIFMPLQVEEEVKRNKLNLFSSKMNEYQDNSKMSKVLLPEHLQGESSSSKEWNSKREELRKKSIELNKELIELKLSLYDDILKSEDKVSLELEKIFENSIEQSEEELEYARLRREVGNPPGKSSDPLGDQICWEQIINRLAKTKAIWIISNDRDYFNKTKDIDILNPLLYEEVKNENDEIEIFCFTSLAKGLKHFDSRPENEIKTLPTIEELERIENEEYRQGFKLPRINSSISPHISNWSLVNKKHHCPYCHNQLNNFDYNETDFGINGTSYIYDCSNCYKKVYLDEMI